MRHFLVLFGDIPISKASVKSGNNSPEVITAARCVNVGLFISGNLRRDVVISLAKGSPDDLKIISFPGANLRRVSPDERSISFFLLKAASIAEDLVMDSLKTMDNGIEVRRTNLKKFIESVAPVRVYLSTPETTTDFIDDTEYDNSLLIYPNDVQFELTEEDAAWILDNLPHFPHPERFILDVNMIVDLKKAS
jgi:tRNA pseudouridine-54 N-methylase